MKKQPPRVFFNASVILAGLSSPSGGSAKLLLWVKQGKIRGTISEIVFGEVLRNAGKINWEMTHIMEELAVLFPKVLPAPTKAEVENWTKIVFDRGDAHIFASGVKASCQFLVSLDKKHILFLKKKVKKPKLVSPAELIELLSKNSRKN